MDLKKSRVLIDGKETPGAKEVVAPDGVFACEGTLTIEKDVLDRLIFDVLFPEQEGVTTWQ